MVILQGFLMDGPWEPGPKLPTIQEVAFLFPSLFSLSFHPPHSPFPALQPLSPFWVLESSSLTLWVLLIPIHGPVSPRASHLTSLFPCL